MSCNNNKQSEKVYYTDPSEFIKKLTKYLVEGIVVAIITRWIASKSLTLQEIAIISLTASMTFMLLDIYSPSIAVGYRNGVGIALGAKTVIAAL